MHLRQQRRGLRRALTARLRTGRKLPNRGGARRNAAAKIPDMPSIVERPTGMGPGGPQVLGRRPDHGSGQRDRDRHLVDRCSRTIKLLHLPDGHSPEQVRDQMIAAVAGMPEALKLSITWDQGIEMHQHRAITEATGVQIYFCDPTAPGSAPPTRTPTGCYASTSPKAPTCRSTHAPTSTTSNGYSTADPAVPDWLTQTSTSNRY